MLQSGHEDKDTLGLRRVPSDLRSSLLFLSILYARPCVRTRTVILILMFEGFPQEMCLRSRHSDSARRELMGDGSIGL